MKKTRATVFKDGENITTNDYFRLLCKLLDAVQDSTLFTKAA